MSIPINTALLCIGLTLGLAAATASAADPEAAEPQGNAAWHGCIGLPTHDQLEDALDYARAQPNGGFSLSGNAA